MFGSEATQFRPVYFINHTNLSLPFDVNNTVMSLSSSYMPTSVQTDVSFFATCCSGASPVQRQLAGGQFNDADLCACWCTAEGQSWT